MIKPIIATALAVVACLAWMPQAEARDGRHFHARGHYVKTLPRAHRVVRVGPSRYYYHAGNYYRPRGNGYVVVGAPIGASVRSLPRGYVSFGIGSRRYFHVNTTYYLWREREKDYVVVEKPSGADDAMERSTVVAQSAEVFVYPREGQAEDVRDRDRYECHQWARGQTDYDPSAVGTSNGSASDYRRAMTACLEGRGYTVR